MSIWPDDNGDATIKRHLQQLRPRTPNSVRVYRCILRGFQRFVQLQCCGNDLTSATIQTWLRERAEHWPLHLVLHRARIVDRFLDYLASNGTIRSNPLEQLRIGYGQRAGQPIVRALLATNSAQALVRSPFSINRDYPHGSSGSRSVRVPTPQSLTQLDHIPGNQPRET